MFYLRHLIVYLPNLRQYHSYLKTSIAAGTKEIFQQIKRVNISTDFQNTMFKRNCRKIPRYDFKFWSGNAELKWNQILCRIWYKIWLIDLYADFLYCNRRWNIVRGTPSDFRMKKRCRCFPVCSIINLRRKSVLVPVIFYEWNMVMFE